MLQANETTPVYADVVDLDRYPIHAPDTAQWRDLVRACQDQLATTGACALEGFIKDEAVARMTAIADELSDDTWATDRTHTVYFQPPDKTVAPEHPLAHQERSAKHAIAYDQIPGDAPLRRLYESDDLTYFIATVLDKPVLYRSADPLDALQMTTMETGEELGWHFDGSEFSITVMYQEAKAGGRFEYVPWLRDDEDENYEQVQNLLQGNTANVRVLSSQPGTLAFFRGRRALHRVTPVEHDKPRINSVLTYGERPDMKLNDLTSEMFYGRTS